MAKEKRFVSEGVESSFMESTKIIIDSETGVHYLFHSSGQSGGLTPLLDSQGKIVVKKPQRNY